MTNSHNTARVDLPEVVQFAENLPLFDIAAHVSPEWRLAHAAWQAADMPAQIVHLEGERA